MALLWSLRKSPPPTPVPFHRTTTNIPLRSWFAYVFTYDGPNRALLGFYNAIVLIMETGFAVVAFTTLILNLILPEEIEDEETPELTANEVDGAVDSEEWARIQRGQGKGSDEEGRASSEIEPAAGKSG